MRRFISGVAWLKLLIGFAVIAILAAVIYPVICQPDYRPNATYCLSNEKQLGLGFLEYMQDYDGRMPRGGSVSSGAGWAGRVYPYIKSYMTFRCPEDRTHGKSTIRAWMEPVSYAVNENLHDDQHGGRVSLRSPASTVLLCEVQGPVVFLTLPNEGAPKSRSLSAAVDGLDFSPRDRIDRLDGTSVEEPFKYATGSMGGIMPVDISRDFTGADGIHNDGSNFLLCDGHVKWLHGSAVSPGRTAVAGHYQNQTSGCAAATDNMKDAAGHQFQATFSPI